MVVIAGAGLIGTSIAWRLSQAGVPVTLHDAGAVGSGASSAGAGMLSPGGELDVPFGVEALRMYPAFVEELAAETGRKIDFRICGCTCLVNEREAERRAAIQTSEGIRVQKVAGGLHYPDDGYVDPLDLLRALRAACEARGVRIIEGYALSEIEAGAHTAVVIAAGSWSNTIHVRYNGRAVELPGVVPVKGHLIGFDLQPGSIDTMRRRGHAYVLQRASGFTIAGSNEELSGFDASIDPAACEWIHQEAAALVPELAGLTPSKRWIGFRPRTADGPLMSRVEETNVWLAYGHYRNGILLAPFTADRVAREITSSDSFRKAEKSVYTHPPKMTVR